MARPALLLLFLALSLVLLPAPHGVRAQPQFFQPCAVTQLDATGPGQPGDITTTFGIGLDPATCTPFASPAERPGQYNFDRLVTFTPPEWYVARDADISDGAVVGSVSSKLVVGLFDNGCQSVTSLPFDLFEATTDRSDKIAPRRVLRFGEPHRAGNHDGRWMAAGEPRTVVEIQGVRYETVYQNRITQR